MNENVEVHVYEPPMLMEMGEFNADTLGGYEPIHPDAAGMWPA